MLLCSLCWWGVDLVVVVFFFYYVLVRVVVVFVFFCFECVSDCAVVDLFMFFVC